jgi:hypothetical protein
MAAYVYYYKADANETANDNILDTLEKLIISGK